MLTVFSFNIFHVKTSRKKYGEYYIRCVLNKSNVVLSMVFKKYLTVETYLKCLTHIFPLCFKPQLIYFVMANPIMLRRIFRTPSFISFELIQQYLRDKPYGSKYGKAGPSLP